MDIITDARMHRMTIFLPNCAVFINRRTLTTRRPATFFNTLTRASRMLPYLSLHALISSWVSQIQFFVGLSALAAEAYRFMVVRSFDSVFVKAYLENRAIDFDDFLHKTTS